VPRPLPPHLHREVNRHGKTVWYFRIGRGQRTRIYGEFGSPQFTDEYQAALAGSPLPPPKKSAPLPKPAGGDKRQVWVYFVRCGNQVKIGKTVDVDSRLASLQTGTSAPLKLIMRLASGPKFERFLHKKFAEHRIRGEWFHIRGDLAEFIEKVR